MSERDELSRKLLAEDGLREGAVRGADREGLRAIVEAERKRSARVSRAMVLSWVVFLLLVAVYLSAIFGHPLGLDPSNHSGQTAYSVVGVLVIASIPLAGVAFIFAIVTTVSWGLRMAFGPRGVEERLDRIEAQLARLEAAQGKDRGEAES